jgi:hypothetical protein
MVLEDALAVMEVDFFAETE